LTVAVALPVFSIFSLSTQRSFYSWGDVQLGPVANLQHAEVAMGRREGRMKKKIVLVKLYFETESLGCWHCFAICII